MACRLILLLRFTLFAAITAAPKIAAIYQLKSGCPTECGELIDIPFPFGTSPECYLDDSFLITCNRTFIPPKAFLRKSTTIEVLNISLDGLMRVSVVVARNCYDKSGERIKGKSKSPRLRLSKFPISNIHNKFTAIGCATAAIIQGISGGNYSTGCISQCGDLENVVNGSCSGVGCCQTSIPKGIRDSIFMVNPFGTNVPKFAPCSHAFVVEEKAFNFSSLDLKNLSGRTEVPVVLDYAVGEESCTEAHLNRTSYACQAKNSECINSTNGPGYRCNCSAGFHGNPYLSDIDECETIKPCSGNCKNLPGTFRCYCSKGYVGDGKKDGSGCRPSNSLWIALGTSMSLLVLLIGSSWVYWMLLKRKLNRQREKFFDRNGGKILREKLSQQKGDAETTKIFTAKDLKKATNKYNKSRVIGRGGQGTVYKGVLPDNKEVAIKKSRIIDEKQVDQFVNEVAILSQINHDNVVKLLGCCLETEVPILVYEFISNGTLHDHIHERRGSSLSWEMRLKIAVEAAQAVAHLHSSAIKPIIHRDIKSTNILLDSKYTAKVADFGASRLIPLGKHHLSTRLEGTIGYIDPEYFQSSKLTEKSDVYSFGVVLAELLTGEEVTSTERDFEDSILAGYFVSWMKDDQLLRILDKRLSKDGKIEMLKKFAMLVKDCLSVKGEDRPTMMQVAEGLKSLSTIEKHPSRDTDASTSVSKGAHNQNVPSKTEKDAFVGSSGSSSTLGFESISDKQ
ncbi:hypothetical protein RJ640_009756 [Escallonia rubra]|uniref:Uncharacterized protein n=1 Tax=Escallonia rubra TaxID=112253 RepID=A0AA88QWF8_9ASTE|nr:hypothetical protein RJ640_009756 [Escallonia rubra]